VEIPCLEGKEMEWRNVSQLLNEFHGVHNLGQCSQVSTTLV
jgi:hypothetical protein